jgi:hypothetical protein
VPYARVNLIPRDTVERLLHFSDIVKGLHVRELLEPFFLVDALDLAEEALDGVIVWRVGKIE